MSTDFIERTTITADDQSASQEFPYVGTPTTCDGA